MTNPFYYAGEYTYSGAFVPGTLARSEQLTSEFTSVQNAFTDFAYQGIDSGTANTYVVTTGGVPAGAYADGQLVQFKAVNASTGACTINVNGIGVVALTRANGSPSQAGDVTANTWFTAAYNSVFSAWTIITPVPVTGFTNTISGAAPTYLVGLTAAGGVATAAVPIDATYAIDQSISPTWTGTHTFSGNVNFNATVSFIGGQALRGAAGLYALTLNGAAVTGQSYGLEVNAGTNASDIAFLVNSQGGTQFFEITGAGSIVVGAATGGGKGVGTINAAGLYINGTAVSTSAISSANPSATVGLAAVNGSAATFMTSDSAPALSQAIAPTMTGAWTFTPSSAVTAITVNAVINAIGLALVGGTNTANTYLMTLATGQGSGFSSGLSINAGTSSADNALLIANAANTSTFMAISGAGITTFNMAAATSGAVIFQGPNAGGTHGWNIEFIDTTASAVRGFIGIGAVTITGAAATDFGIASGVGGRVCIGGANGDHIVLAIADTTIQGRGPTAGALVDMTPDTGTFTITYTGMTASVTGMAVWARVGNLVSLYFPAATGTSNSTQFAATGLPAEIATARLQHMAIPFSGMENGSGPADGDAQVVINGTTVTFWLDGLGTGWTNSGSKGVLNAFTISYLLN